MVFGPLWGKWSQWHSTRPTRRSGAGLGCASTRRRFFGLGFPGCHDAVVGAVGPGARGRLGRRFGTGPALLLGPRPLVLDLGGLEAADAHEFAHVPGVALEQDCGPAELAPALGGAGAHQVRCERVVPLELAGPRDLEALRHGLVGLVLVTHLLCLGKHNNPPMRVMKGRDDSRGPGASPDRAAS